MFSVHWCHLRLEMESYLFPVIPHATRRGAISQAALDLSPRSLRPLEVQAQETQQRISGGEGIAGTQGFDGSGC